MTNESEQSSVEKPIDPSIPEVTVEEEVDPLSLALTEIEKWRDLALRTQADLDNYRKRMAREKSDAILYANVNLLHSLLPVLDNFEMGLQAAKQENESGVIYQGFLMVRKQIEDFLADQGVRPVPATGPFDPNQHEAVTQAHSDTVTEGHIVAELRRGYRLNDRLLRAANVIISKGPETPAA